VLRPPKGRRSRRIDLSEHDIQLLQAHHERHLTRYTSDWVFTDTEGKALQRHNFRHRAWRQIVRDAGLEPLRFHDLRHTAATLSLAEGVPLKVVQERLGHASAKMTLDVYAKSVPSLQQKAAEQMTDIFGDWHTSCHTPAGDDGKNVVK
jgi:integrase